jgi:hypothetical protein
MSESSLQRIEMGEQSVGLDMLEQLCAQLHCEIGDLFPPGHHATVLSLSCCTRQPYLSSVDWHNVSICDENAVLHRFVSTEKYSPFRPQRATARHGLDMPLRIS